MKLFRRVVGILALGAVAVFAFIVVEALDEVERRGDPQLLNEESALWKRKE